MTGLVQRQSNGLRHTLTSSTCFSSQSFIWSLAGAHLRGHARLLLTPGIQMRLWHASLMKASSCSYAKVEMTPDAAGTIMFWRVTVHSRVQEAFLIGFNSSASLHTANSSADIFISTVAPHFILVLQPLQMECYPKVHMSFFLRIMVL